MEALGLVRRSTVPRLMVGGAGAAYCIVFALLAVYGRPGLGIGQGFYLPIALIALAAGPFTGAGAGIASAILYASALDVVNGSGAAGPSAVSVAIRLASYVAVGVTIGYIARSGRRMLAKSLHLLDELLLLAGREVESGALSPSGFEAAVLRRIDHGWPFAILIGEVRPARSSGRVPSERPSDDLENAMRDAASCLPTGYPLARAGHSRIAVVIPEGTATSSLEACGQLSDQLGQRGWWAAFSHASYPEDGTEMMPLLQTAVERLHHAVESARVR